MADTSAPNRRSIGERKLIAILFTDVVGFSARAQQNEALAIRLIKRDFEAMKRCCAEMGGQVLKTTGDGLLMSFPTATAAVGCAQTVQSMLLRHAKNNPPEQVLHHRIGIHLGDVFVDDMDVMGNDVNIAARVLAEAGGGQICVSQTVYDVVKTRLTLKGIFLGERELKNVGKITIYRLPMTEEEAKLGAPVSPNAAAPQPAKKKRSLMIPIVLICALAAATILTWTILHNQKSDSPGSASAANGTTQPSMMPTPTAQYVSTLQRDGDWKGKFGSIAALVFGDFPTTMPDKPMKIPLEKDAGVLEINFSGGTISALPNGARLLRKGMQRVKSTDYVNAALVAQNNLAIDLRFPDMKKRRVTIYCTHPGNHEPQRTETATLFNPINDTSLATQTITDFQDGVYTSFDISGFTQLRLHSTSPDRVVISGLFVDPVPSR